MDTQYRIEHFSELTYREKLEIILKLLLDINDKLGRSLGLSKEFTESEEYKAKHRAMVDAILERP